MIYKSILVLVILLVSGNAFAEKSLKLNWQYDFIPKEHTFSGKYGFLYLGVPNIHEYRVDGNASQRKLLINSIGAFRVYKAKFDRDRVVVELIVHNKSKSSYQCVFLNNGEKFSYMDDELGNEYKGAKVSFANGLDNKLAVNQRKKVIIKIPRPDDDADIVNVHFGITFIAISSEKNCPKPIVNGKMNFHKLNWDLSALRE